MSLLAPLAFALGVIAAGVIVALHLLTTRRPPAELLPTARFVPMAEARAVARTRRPTDLLLLALRVLALMLIGAAFARPVLDAPGPEVRSVVLLDLSAAVASPAEAAARARESLGEGSALVVFDTAARVVPVDSLDALVNDARSSRATRGALSPAFAAARRVAGEVARGADSLRLVVVSPLLDDGVDAATGAWRAAWPGRVEFVRSSPRAVAPGPRGAPELIGATADDPLVPAVAQLAPGAHAVRIIRRTVGAADSAWAREEGRVLLSWPVADGGLSADAVHVPGPGGLTLVAPLVRSAIPDGRVLARWRDGAPAVTESPLGAGCLRAVGVGIPRAGDLTLRAPFARFLSMVTAPCGGATGAPLADSVVVAMAGTGPLAAARALAVEGAGESGFPALLLALALFGLGVEWWLRRRQAR